MGLSKVITIVLIRGRQEGQSQTCDYRSRNQRVRKRLEETPAGFEDGGNGNEPSNADSL